MSGAQMYETHISIVFMVGDRAYKLKKPVKLDFIDLSTRELRQRCCEREVELNRRVAPDVYLGVSDIVGPDGAVCDHLVVMRRMPADRRLSTLARNGGVTDADLRELAQVLATFHDHAETSPAIAAAGTVDRIGEGWEAGFHEIAPFVGHVLDPRTEEEIQASCRRYLAGRRPLFTDRVTGSKVRDGHGDLLADDVFLLPDGPRALDCLEFDDQLRYGDVLADLAFLVMDLERVGAPDLGIALLDHYGDISRERFPTTLTHHYIAMRAHIRAKVACLRDSQGDPDAADEARRLHEMTRAHLQQGRVALVLVGGAPGTGKSTVAAGIGTQMGWNVIRSDEIRKDLAHVEPTTRLTAAFGEGAYDEASTAATYRGMLERARRHLEFGECVVLDATWHDAAWRHAAAELAASTSSDLVELRCDAPFAVTEQRIRARTRDGHDASDATAAIAAQVEQATDPWPSATRVDTAGDPATALEIALHAFGHLG